VIAEMQIPLFLVGLGLLLGSRAIGHLLTVCRGVPRATGPGIRGLALPKINITWVGIIYGVMMLVGISAKEIWDNMNESGMLYVRWPRIIGALIVSPIVYSAVYSQFVKNEVSPLGLAVAFQNGFFWQAVFRTQAGA